MNTYRVTFKSNEAFNVQANDLEHAQEVAIETLESFGIVHSEVVGIVRTEYDPKGQFVGMSPDGFACYTNVSL